jgi:SAF domain
LSDTVRFLDTQPARTAPLPTPPAAAQLVGARRSPARLVAGLIVVAAAVLAFVTLDLRADHKRQVLAVTTSVAAGQPLSAADVVAVAVDAEAGIPLVPASELASVVGRTAAVPLVRGQLLAPRLLGPAAFPPAGQAVIAVDVKPGQAPAGLQPGSAVLVLTAPAADASGASASAGAATVSATVIAVDEAADGSGDLVVSLLMSRSDAVALGGTATSSVSLVLVGQAH